MVVAADPIDVKTALAHRQYDLIIFNLGCAGLSLLKTVITHRAHAKILLLSSKAHFKNCLKGLNLGADDYLEQPLQLKQLMSRIKNLNQRKTSSNRAIIRLGDLSLDVASKQLRFKNTRVRLTPSEYKILEFLLRNQNEVMSHQRINTGARGKTPDTPKNSTEAHICTLRRKLNQLGVPDLIQTRRGFGYMVEPEISQY